MLLHADSLCCAHVILLVLSCTGSLLLQNVMSLSILSLTFKMNVYIFFLNVNRSVLVSQLLLFHKFNQSFHENTFPGV